MFSRIALWRKRLQLDSKSDLTTKSDFGIFCWKMASSLTSYLYGLIFATIVQLLSFFDDIVIIVLWGLLREPVNEPARWWHCACLKCVSGLRRLKKTLNFLRCILVVDLVFNYGSDINEGNWLQLLFFFNVLMVIVTSVIGMSFFLAVFQALDWCCLVFYIYGSVCNWIPNEIWPRKDWFWDFLFENGFFVDFRSVWIENLNYRSIIILLLRHQSFSMFSLRGILVCSSKKLVLFRHRIL